MFSITAKSVSNNEDPQKKTAVDNHVEPNGQGNHFKLRNTDNESKELVSPSLCPFVAGPELAFGRNMALTNGFLAHVLRSPTNKNDYLFQHKHHSVERTISANRKVLNGIGISINSGTGKD